MHLCYYYYYLYYSNVKSLTAMNFSRKGRSVSTDQGLIFKSRIVGQTLGWLNTQFVYEI